MKRISTIILATLLMSSLLPINNSQAATDTEEPYVWAANVSPNYNTTGTVDIQIQAGDTGTGVKNITLPNNSVVSGNIANYTVSQNGKYLFKITDYAGNVYTHPIFISNIDKTPPTISFLSLTKNKNGTFKASIKASDNVEIKTVILNTNQKITKGPNEDKYVIDGLTTMPTSVTVTDTAGLTATGSFLSLPTLTYALPATSTNAPYSSSKVIKEDVLVSINGNDTVNYSVGVKNYSCTNKPCTFSLNKNSEITATNSIQGKTSTLISEVTNINKTKNNLILSSTRSNGKINLSWNLPVSSPVVKCESLSAGKTTKSVTGTTYSFSVLNENYQCSISGQYDKYDISSDTINITPDYTKDIYVYTPSSSYAKETFSKVYVDYSMLGVTYFINANRNDSGSQSVPIPDSLK